MQRLRAYCSVFERLVLPDKTLVFHPNPQVGEQRYGAFGADGPATLRPEPADFALDVVEHAVPTQLPGEQFSWTIAILCCGCQLRRYSARQIDATGPLKGAFRVSYDVSSSVTAASATHTGATTRAPARSEQKAGVSWRYNLVSYILDGLVNRAGIEDNRAS